MFIQARYLFLAALIILALLLAVSLLAAVLVRWRKRQKERDMRSYSPETDDPALLHAQIRRLQPCLLQIALDGLEALRQDFRESERAELRAGIEAILEEWAGVHEGLLSKLEDGRYQLLVQYPMLQRMVEAKFPILDSVRSYQFRGKHVGVTVSIGVGQGDAWSACGDNSRQALDLALGRGGDQVALKNPDGSYQFFGGVSKRVEKTEKVKVRIMATAFAELIRSSDQVYVMGHKRGDFDALGAAAGVCAMARAQGRPASIVLDLENSMAKPMLETWRGQPGAPPVIPPRKALNDMSVKTLLILVDFHVPQLADSKQLLEQAKLLAVIDHHRQAVDRVPNAHIFFLDPGVSSCSEMVAELLQYTVPAPKIDPLTADALLAGIQLDTRHFVLRTGASTFEAAAFLRDNGADPVRVQRLFSGEQEDIRRKMEILTRARFINRCAVSIARPGDFAGDLRLICSQAADELLNLEDVDAAFVLYAEDDKISISARSLGERNVQVIMEQMGGGGHQTMAAAQLPSPPYTMEDAVRMLAEKIQQ